jgi:hypothetical protein
MGLQVVEGENNEQWRRMTGMQINLAITGRVVVV